MTKTVFPKAIKSRPIYGELTPRPGAAHLAIADGEGAAALVDLVAKAGTGMRATLHIIYTPGSNGIDLGDRLKTLGAPQLYLSPTFPAALPRLRRVLADAHMGMQFYLAGTEGLMGQAEREIMETGFPFSAIQKEHRGSTARRMQCVHCKGITENVRHDPFPCSHCQRHLFVRDHYSRRIAAFQGVAIDAEDPGKVPPSLERFT